VYVTQWLPMPWSPRGKRDAGNTLAEKLAPLASLASLALGVKATTLFRCDRTAQSESASFKWVCADAPGLDGRAFVSANGIAISTDRTALFVNDLPTRCQQQPASTAQSHACRSR
jgi:hypothetical protein